MRIVPKLPLTLNEISVALGVKCRDSNSLIGAIVTNSKETKPSDLFVALEGDRLSGEDFIDEAKGNKAFILSEKYEDADIRVHNTKSALLNIAAYYKKHKLKNLRHTIAITGSVGKTTTKNMVSQILKSKYSVHSTYENYNNYLGVAHTVLTSPPDSQILIVEMGMNHLGEISALSKAVMPDISVITNIGSAHIGNLGSKKGIAKAKLEILEGMENPIVILPHEEKLLKNVIGRYSFSVYDRDADCYLESHEANLFNNHFNIYTHRQCARDLSISIRGKHILSSVAIGASILDNMGEDLNILNYCLPEIKEESIVRAKMIRCGNYDIYDDTYSSSYEATIADFELLAGQRRRISCVLGDMLELGTKSQELHEKIGAAVVKYGFEKLFTFGISASYIAKAALRCGMKKENVFINEDINAPKITAEQIKRSCDGSELILFKASHSVHAERIFNYLD